MIWQELSGIMARNAAHPALVAGGSSWTYAQLAGLAEQIAIAPSRPGEKSPRRILIRPSEPAAVLVNVLGCWRAGCVPVVLRESMGERQIGELAAWLRPAGELAGSLPPASADTIPEGRAFHRRGEALVICTSGTTGIPKLVALPAESVCINATVIGRSLGLGPGERVAVNTPLGFMYGLMGGCMASLWHGASCILFHPRDPIPQLQAAIRRHGVTVVQGPPSLFRLFMAYWNGDPFPCVRVVTTGGEPLGEDLREALAKAFPVAQRLFLYGMTEAGPRLSHTSFENGGGLDGVIGTPYSHVSWRLAPTEGLSQDSNTGRLVLRGPAMFLGYVTAEGGYAGLDSEGYFHTQDLVALGSDGRLRFRGRIDRIFRSGGKLVNPDALESVLAMHPDVSEAACRAASHPVLGLVPVAEVALTPGASFDEKELRRWCAERVENHALPRSINCRTSWTPGESGKRQP